jgi:hypothetical protein
VRRSAPGAVNSSDIADGSILGKADIANPTLGTAESGGQFRHDRKLGDNLDLAPRRERQPDVPHTAGTPAITLNGANTISVFGDDGSELVSLRQLRRGFLRDSVGHETAARLTANGNAGGRLSLYNQRPDPRWSAAKTLAVSSRIRPTAQRRCSLDGNNSYGAANSLFTRPTGIRACFTATRATGYGALSLRNAAGNPRVRLYGGATSGSMAIYDTSGTETFQVLAAASSSTGSELHAEWRWQHHD